MRDPQSITGAAAAPAPVLSPQPHWSAFLRTFFFCCIVFLVAVALFNLWANPEGLFPTKFLPPVIADQRPEKVYLLSTRRPKPEALVLGSSRTMKIEPTLVERYTGLRTFNAAVFGGYTEDDYALLRYAVEKAGIQPRLVIIGVEWENFADDPRNNYLTRPNPLSEYLPGTPAWLGYLDLVGTAISWPETSLSLDAVGKFVLRRTPPPPQIHIEPDGYLIRDQDERAKANGTFQLGHLMVYSRKIYQQRLRSFSFHPERVRYFQELLQYCRQRHIRVMVFATPVYHEIFEGEDAADRQREQAAVDTMRTLAEQGGASFDDFLHVESFGGEPEAFFDGTHIDTRNATLLTAAMLAPRSARALQ